MIGRQTRTYLIPLVFRSPVSIMCLVQVLYTNAFAEQADSLAQARLDLAQEYKSSLEDGRARTFEVSPSSFLLLGMDMQGTM